MLAASEAPGYRTGIRVSGKPRGHKLQILSPLSTQRICWVIIHLKGKKELVEAVVVVAVAGGWGDGGGGGGGGRIEREGREGDRG